MNDPVLEYFLAYFEICEAEIGANPDQADDAWLRIHSNYYGADTTTESRDDINRRGQNYDAYREAWRERSYQLP